MVVSPTTVAAALNAVTVGRTAPYVRLSVTGLARPLYLVRSGEELFLAVTPGAKPLTVAADTGVMLRLAAAIGFPLPAVTLSVNANNYSTAADAVGSLFALAATVGLVGKVSVA